MKLNIAALAAYATAASTLANAQSTGAGQLCNTNPKTSVSLGTLNNAKNTPTFLLNGQPWIPRGLQIRGFVSSISTARALHYQSTIDAQNVYGQTEIDTAVDDFGADMLRIQVSQADLDPEYHHPKMGSSPAEKASYLHKVIKAIKLARKNCLVVIISMQAEKHSGVVQRTQLPSHSTRRAWAALLNTTKGATLAADQGIMLEIYNEPGGDANTTAWERWAHAGQGKLRHYRDNGTNETVFGMQSMIDYFRRPVSDKGLNSINVLIVDGLEIAQTFKGVDKITRHLVDPMGTPYQIAYAVHPYFHIVTQRHEEDGLYDYPQQWGFLRREGANNRPPAVVLATEWSAQEGKTQGLGLGYPRNTSQVTNLLNYMIQHRVPMSAGAFDIPHIMVQAIPSKNGSAPRRGSWVPTNYDHYHKNHCKNSGNNAGLFIKTMFQTKYSRPLVAADGVTANMSTPLWCTKSSS